MCRPHPPPSYHARCGYLPGCCAKSPLTQPEVFRLEVDRGEAIALDWYPGHSPSPAVLFIPGLGSQRRGEKARCFAAGFVAEGRAFASLDLRGHGDSDGAVRDLTMSRMLADVSVAAAWLAAQAGTSRIVLIGASMGAALAAWHAARHPESIAALVLLAPALGFPTALVRTLDRAALTRWRSSGAHRLRSEWIDVELGRALLDDAAHYDAGELTRTLATPALLIHGMRDQTIPWEHSVDFVRTQRRTAADLHLVAAGDHRLTDQRELLFALFSAWLAQSGRG